MGFGFGSRVSGFGFRVSRFRFWVSGFRCRDSGFSVLGFRVSGLGIRVYQGADGLEEEDRLRLVEAVERHLVRGFWVQASGFRDKGLGFR